MQAVSGRYQWQIREAALLFLWDRFGIAKKCLVFSWIACLLTSYLHMDVDRSIIWRRLGSVLHENSHLLPQPFVKLDIFYGCLRRFPIFPRQIVKFAIPSSPIDWQKLDVAIYPATYCKFHTFFPINHFTKLAILSSQSFAKFHQLFCNATDWWNFFFPPPLVVISDMFFHCWLIKVIIFFKGRSFDRI